MEGAATAPSLAFMGEKELPKDKKKARAFDIITIVISSLLFLFIAYEIAIKISGNSLYLFGIRSDIVVSDSMSYKNEDEDVQSFLEGHDDQFSKGDVIYSVKIDENTALNIYDCVMFSNPDNGKLTTHRIVNIVERDGESRYILRADSANLSSSDGAFPRSMLIAKKVGAFPKIGYLLAFLQSFYGMAFGVGVIVILILLDYFLGKEKKKKSEGKEDEGAK